MIDWADYAYNDERSEMLASDNGCERNFICLFPGPTDFPPPSPPGLFSGAIPPAAGVNTDAPVMDQSEENGHYLPGNLLIFLKCQ